MAKFSDENLVEEARATAQPRGLNGTRLKQPAKPTQKQLSNQRSGLVQDSEHETAATALLKVCSFHCVFLSLHDMAFVSQGNTDTTLA